MPAESSPTYTCTDTSGAAAMYQGSYIIQGEILNSGSVLIGKLVSKLEVHLATYGSPGGSVTLGVWNSSGVLQHTFGTEHVDNIPSYPTYSWIAKESSSGYTLQQGDIFGVKYDDSTSSSSHLVFASHDDQNPPFDTTNTVKTRYNTTSNPNDSLDLSFKLYLHEGGSGGSGGGGSDPPTQYTDGESKAHAHLKPLHIFRRQRDWF